MIPMRASEVPWYHAGSRTAKLWYRALVEVIRAGEGMADVATSTGLAPDAARAPARPARRLSPGLFAWALIAPALLFIGVIVESIQTLREERAAPERAAEEAEEDRERADVRAILAEVRALRAELASRARS